MSDDGDHSSWHQIEKIAIPTMIGLGLGGAGLYGASKMGMFEGVGAAEEGLAAEGAGMGGAEAEEAGAASRSYGRAAIPTAERVVADAPMAAPVENAPSRMRFNQETGQISSHGSSFGSAPMAAMVDPPSAPLAPTSAARPSIPMGRAVGRTPVSSRSSRSTRRSSSRRGVVRQGNYGGF